MKYDELKREYEEYATIHERALCHVLTSIDDFCEEARLKNGRSPIIAIHHRIKTFDSALKKCQKKVKGNISIKTIMEKVNDIVGARLITLYEDEIFEVADALNSRLRLNVTTTKDYINEPKPSGYRSLHLIVQREIYFNNSTHIVPVEVQIRTKAMDLWSVYEHMFKYKNDDPSPVVEEKFHKAAEFLNAFEKSIIELRDFNSK